jgi:hypothetical protein
MEVSRRRSPATPFTMVLSAVVALVLPASADSTLSQRDADSLARKLSSILQYGESPLDGARLTPMSEVELNAFLGLVVADQLPPGVTRPSLELLGDGQVIARAVVDLDAMKRTGRQGDALDPRQWLSGRVPVSAQGRVRAEDGVARFELSSAEVSGVPIPKPLLQQIVTYYSRSDQFPDGVDLDAPFELPARIREIHVNPRQAVVVQR